jgi:hypothetical protein
MKSPKDVSQLQYITTTEDIAAMIDIVEVCGDAGDMPSVNAVQKILRRTINITCLTLVFSFDSMLHVLPTSNPFGNLTHLNVNATHSAVAQFLFHHPRITSLVLGTCHAPICPLSHISLLFLKTLTCPPSCVRALASVATPLTNLASHGTISQDTNLPQTPLLQLLNFTTIPTSSTITTLDLNINHPTTSLLQRISSAAPALRVLRLTESPFPNEVSHSFEIRTIDGLM